MANQKINANEIARLFGISTTPVREAVLMLGAEGFVTINSHREAIVKEISYEELREMGRVLELLDSLGSSLAMDNLSSEKLKELEYLTEEMERFCYLRSIEKYMDLNIGIHQKIWECIPNRFLHSTLRSVSNQILRYKYLYIYAFKRPRVLENSMNEHREILQALKIRDKKKLKYLILGHWSFPLQAYPFEEGLKEYSRMSERR